MIVVAAALVVVAITAAAHAVATAVAAAAATRPGGCGRGAEAVHADGGVNLAGTIYKGTKDMSQGMAGRLQVRCACECSEWFALVRGQVEWLPLFAGAWFLFGSSKDKGRALDAAAVQMYDCVMLIWVGFLEWVRCVDNGGIVERKRRGRVLVCDER